MAHPTKPTKQVDKQTAMNPRPEGVPSGAGKFDRPSSKDINAGKLTTIGK